MRELSWVTALISSAFTDSRPLSSLVLPASLPSRSTCATDPMPDMYDPWVTSRTLLSAREPTVDEPGLRFGPAPRNPSACLELYNLACWAKSANLRLPERIVHNANTVSTLPEGTNVGAVSSYHVDRGSSPVAPRTRVEPC